MGTYIVQGGDTLGSIAERKLGRATRWPEIAFLNHLQNSKSLFVGQSLRLPDTWSENMGHSSTPGPLCLTNPNEGLFQYPANVALARGFLFVVFEQLPEVGTEKIIRKVIKIPHDFSLKPKNPLANITLAEHVYFDPKNTQFLSASNRPFGAASMKGQPLILDVAKIQQAGGKIHSVSEIISDLERFVAQNPSSRTTVDRLISTIRNIEGEVLIEGGTPPGSAKLPSAAHTSHIQSSEALWKEYLARRITRAQLQQELTILERGYSRARVLGRVGRVLTVIGVVVTVADLAMATRRTIEQESFRPLGAEVMRQVGGWGSAFAGAKIGFATGALFGIETGPGAIATGAIGAIVFGAAGYFGADWIADHISPN